MTLLETEPTAVKVNGKGLKRTVHDGVVRWTASQSWLNNFQKCPEQARLGMHGLLPRTESDATAIGTATHTGIEAVLRHGADRYQAADAAVDKFEELSGLENFEYVQVKSRGTAVRYVESCVDAWYDYVYPQLGSALSIEQPFEVCLDRREPPPLPTPWPEGQRTPQPRFRQPEELWLTGTWDFECDAFGLWDWKTGARPYEAWEVNRWYVQPTVYCYARSILRGNEGLDTDTFNYAIMLKGPTPRPPQILDDVQRGPAHYDWLRKQFWSIVNLHKATDGGSQGWPLMDQSWLCSPKWCPAYAGCKGVPQ
jgi:hypothetical protein